MTPEQVEYLKDEHLRASRAYSRATDRAAWREGEPNHEAAALSMRMRLTAKAWENAERELQAVTCPPRLMRGPGLPLVDVGQPEGEA